MQTFIEYFNIISLKEISALILQSHQNVLHFRSNVLFIFLLLSTGIWYLLIVSNIPEDGGYADGCWKVEINNSYILWSTGYGLLSPLSAWSKAWVCGRLIAGIAGSNPAEAMDAFLF